MTPSCTDDSESWRIEIGRKLFWLFILKLGLLMLLWVFCFSPSHRNPVNAIATGRHLAVDGATASSRAAQITSEETVRE
jgi:hypothetical protein